MIGALCFTLALFFISVTKLLHKSWLPLALLPSMLTILYQFNGNVLHRKDHQIPLCDKVRACVQTGSTT